MGVRHAAAIALIVALPPTAAPTPADALALARRYFVGWHATLSSLIAEEHYQQRLSRRAPDTFGRQQLKVEERRLRSEVLLLRSDSEKVWLPFRNVLEVDGRSVADHAAQFETLFAGAEPVPLSTAERLTAESERFALESRRLTNATTAALVFLNPKYEANTTWTLNSHARLNGRAMWELLFEQHTPPYAVLMPTGLAARCSGRLWLEPRSGAIPKTELRVKAGATMLTVVVSYGQVSSIPENWVPLQMDERYETYPTEVFRGRATYTKHRLFRTSGRIVGE